MGAHPRHATLSYPTPGQSTGAPTGAICNLTFNGPDGAAGTTDDLRCIVTYDELRLVLMKIAS